MKLCLTSDLHGNLPDIPECDLLLIAGDLALDKFKANNYVFPDPTGQREWLYGPFAEWVNKLDCRTLATLGNHDWVKHDWPHMVKVDQLVKTHAGNIWFSPWSGLFGGWSYMLSEEQLTAYYAAIPKDVDILVTHGPPYGHGDKSYVTMIGGGDPHVGSKALRDHIERTKPKLVVCGHIHGGYGSYKIGETDVYNVSLNDESYKPVNKPVVLEWNV